jgi:hypothetical protein
MASYSIHIKKAMQGHGFLATEKLTEFFEFLYSKNERKQNGHG